MDRNALMAGYSRGGVLDKLGLDQSPMQVQQTPSLLQRLTDYAGRGLGVVDHWAMGIPSTMAGLVNSAIPGQPLGDLSSAKSAAEDARSAVAQSGYADLMALPDALMGSLGNVPANARPAAQMAGPAARQAGRLAESAIDPVYNAMPSNAVGSAGGKLTPPPAGITSGIPQAPSGISGWHGSPHDWNAERLVRYPDGRTEYVVGSPGRLPDIPSGAEVAKDFPLGRFRMDKIGTGEGKQAYGYGGYIAENEGVAKQYRNNLTQQTRGTAKTNADTTEPWYRLFHEKYGGKLQDDIGIVYPSINSVLTKMQRGGDLSWVPADLRLALQTRVNPGRMYEVRINASPDDFLDWNKPLSQQSEKVRRAWYEYATSPDAAKKAEKYYSYKPGMALSDLPEFKEPYGSTLYRQLPGASDAEAAARLRDAGIPGIRYFDQGSRNAGEGSRNYVLFRDDIIDVVKKYGIAAAASMYGMDQVSQAMGDTEKQNPLMQGY